MKTNFNKIVDKYLKESKSDATIAEIIFKDMKVDEDMVEPDSPESEGVFTMYKEDGRWMFTDTDVYGDIVEKTPEKAAKELVKLLSDDEAILNVGNYKINYIK
jgi:hypothetical protein